MNTPEYPDKKRNLDQFIEKVERLERKRRRHIGQISLVALAVLGGISTLFWKMNGNNIDPPIQETFRSYYSSELNPENIRTLFEENKQRIIVVYDETTESDTVGSVREYLEIFHPFTTSPVVKGSIVSSELAGQDEWEYDAQSNINESASKRDRKREDRKSSSDSKKSTNNFSDSSKSLEKATKDLSPTDPPTSLTLTEELQPVKKAYSSTDGSDESAGSDKNISQKAIASISNPTDSKQTNPIKQGAVRARNLPSGPADPASVSPATTNSAKSAPSSAPPVDPNEPLEIADRMPSFPGGTVALQQFLDSRLAYPHEAREHEIEGKVYIRFVVNADGSLSKFQLLRGIGYGCDEEAMRVAKSLPKWIPGRQGLTRVSVKYTLPIRFKLQ